MKFAHLADCHMGGWRDPKLREANAKAFVLAVDTCINEKVDFVLIAGDLFNTAVPAIDSLRIVVEQLKRLKDANLAVYFIAGSHDFSPSGKTMLDVIEQAGLGINVARGEELPDGRFTLKFTVDPKTKIKVTGMIGKKGGLEAGYYCFLAKEQLEKEQGSKIFMFHSAIAELKPKELERMDAMACSMMPRGFDYYAGGHVHIVDKISLDHYKNIVYPGPVFPNSFSELEKLGRGNMVIVEDWSSRNVPLIVNPVFSITVDAENKTVSEVDALLKKTIESQELTNAIVTIRVQGCISQGRPADISWNDLLHSAYAKKAYAVLRNTGSLTSKELQITVVKEANVEELEERLLQEHANQFKLSEDDVELARKLMHILSSERAEGERVGDFEGRLHGEMDTLIK
ncbi:MAG TPA: exonuclease SbcCD subunit D [Candidatus Nanoarchaeia archaeon]|nr:exonuclease SbcCD subunit D [Candidatus Nanoarchaeia archaeon]